MSKDKLLMVAGLVVALAVTGCAKKVSEDASKAGSGFDNLSTSDELAQLPQAPATDKQTAVEPLPIEAAPVTQAAPAAAQTASENAAANVSSAGAASQGKSSRDQKIQQALKTAGFYNGNVDGKIGPMTKKSIEEFQKAHGLKADGKVGPKTWAALEAVLKGQDTAAVAEAPAAQSTDKAGAVQ